VFERRATALEKLDRQDFGQEEVRGTFRYPVPVNRWFGGIRPQLRFFQRESLGWERRCPQSILDVGCGAGDVAVALVRWGRQHGQRIRIRAIDSHPDIVDLARQRCREYPEISVHLQNVLETRTVLYDYVHASQFLHHVEDAEVGNVLRHLLGMCRRAVVVNDLVRSPLHYGAAWLLSLLASPVFRHDARLSIRKGFRLEELRRLLAEQRFADHRLEKHFFYRFLLILTRRGD
jgi:2-polyprenyl-3-methyl-5-hydroxy-6-metoxy-1,4-benzoquinol methylase